MKNCLVFGVNPLSLKFIVELFKIYLNKWDLNRNKQIKLKVRIYIHYNLLNSCSTFGVNPINTKFKVLASSYVIAEKFFLQFGKVFTQYGKVFMQVRKSFHPSAKKFSRKCGKFFTHVRKNFHASAENFSRTCGKIFTQVRKFSRKEEDDPLLE